MKKVLRGFFITIMVFILTSANAFAMPYNPNEYTSVDLPSEILPPSIKISKTHEGATARGDFFIGADLIIKDNGNGDVGVFAKAYMSIPTAGWNASPTPPWTGHGSSGRRSGDRHGPDYGFIYFYSGCQKRRGSLWQLRPYTAPIQRPSQS